MSDGRILFARGKPVPYAATQRSLELARMSRSAEALELELELEEDRRKFDLAKARREAAFYKGRLEMVMDHVKAGVEVLGDPLDPNWKVNPRLAGRDR